jgi:hypothetical protein
MPIDLVIDERDSSKPLPDLTGSTNGNDGTRSNADSTSHDGASTPDVVSTTSPSSYFPVENDAIAHYSRQLISMIST